MAAWWLRKSRKAKQQHPEKQQPETSPVCLKDSYDISSRNDKAKRLDESIPSPSPSRSFIYTSPRSSRELVSWGCSGGGGGGGGGGFPGVDSDGKEKRSKSLPLPRPCVSSTPSMGSDLVGVNSGSGSTSVSSVSSSGSSDDAHHFGGVHRGHGEPNIITRSKSPVPVSRGATSPLSHLHSLPVGGSSLDSPPARLEEGKNPCHRLPLPPASPTSSSSMYNNIRATELAESANHVPPKWKKGRLLGRGTFGHVYLGFNSENGQMCAMKEVRLISDDQTSKESLKQLNQEISLLSQLSHPNIVQYYGCELGEEALSVYLEYVSGGSIYKLLQEYGSFKEPVIQNYTRKILSGLAYLHGKNTVHRDIKGANILVDPNGEIKLADFGMAKHIAASSSMLSFKGSPYWMAPEVVMNQNGYSLAVDIWSLGCTILEMATSKPPWSQYEGVAAIFKIGNSKDVPEIPEHLSNDAKNFVMLCLQRDPSARPTALELLDHPFVRDQTTCGVASINVTRDITPSTYDGCQSSQPDLGLLSHKKIFTSRGGDHKTNQAAFPISRGLKGPRFWGSSKTITSLPVSPCSSPLRRSGPAHQSCFLSPPLPTYAMGHSNYNLSDYSGFPTRQNPRYTLGSWREIPQRKT